MRLFTLCRVALLAVSLASVARADDKADHIVQLADEARGPQVAFSMTVEVKDIHGDEKKDSVYHCYSKGVRFSRVEQTEPARSQGRKLLMRDHDLWLFTPNISRPTRVSFEQRLTGEVANGDLMRTNFSQDYSATILGQETLDGTKTYKLKLLARTKDVTYSRIDYWVDSAKMFPLKAEFYALSGKLLKTARYSGFKTVMGKTRMTSAVITDALQSNRKSILTYSHQRAENLSETFFNKESLGD